MVKVSDLWDYLKLRKYTFCSSVPCSMLKKLLDSGIKDPEITLIPAVKENVALGLASGAYLSGKKSCIFMQNSGLGNIINALTSFNLIYKIPVLMFLTWRGFEGKDAPEHLIMGKKMAPLLDSLEVPHRQLTATVSRSSLSNVFCGGTREHTVSGMSV